MFETIALLARARRVVMLLVLVPAMAGAQTADPHPDRRGAASAAPAQSAPVPGMRHDAMPGMDPGSMPMASQPAKAKPAAPIARLASDPMGAMTMPDGSTMAMAPMPQGIVRRSSGPAETALQAFADALEVGSRALAVARLDPDLQVVENGRTEDYAAYTGGHLDADMAFQKTVRSILLDRNVVREGADRTRIVSTIRILSNRSDKRVDMTVSESATLVRSSEGWRIRRIEWVAAAAGER